MNATIIAIGDELLLGKTVNNNAAFISARLAALGIPSRRQLVVGDAPAEIAAALDTARSLGTLAVTTGGLGPTDDDVTLAAVAAYFSRDLVLHRPTLEEIERRFARRGIPMPAVNVSQARVPAGARVLRNPLGTAPGIVMEESDVTVCLLPGVPAEMEYIFEHGVVPYLEEKGYLGERVFEWQFHVAGLPESAVAERLAGAAVPDGVKLAYLPQAGQVDLRLWGPAPDAAAFRRRAWPARDAIYDALGDDIFGEDDATLEAVVATALAARGETLAVGESCTGGLLAKRLTDVAGASTWFAGGVVAYANRAKEALLGVTAATLEVSGAVSEEVAAEMAAGARNRLAADYGLAITGVAGPAGGTEGKPVGTLCFGLAAARGVATVTRLFGGGRGAVRLRASQYALDLLRRRLREKEKSI
jgi:nicotinamide-nucleotide amidase